MRTKLAAAAVMSLAIAMAVPSAGYAKSPPKGTYECVIGASHQLFGNIKVRGGGKYRYSRPGKTGKIGKTVAGKKLRRFGDSGGVGTLGYSIRFKGGGLNKYKGYWFTSTTGTHEIALENPRNGIESIYCDD